MTSNQEDKLFELHVDVGTHVDLELISESGAVERLAVDVVPDNAADFAQGFLGASAALAQAIMGRPAGVLVPYRMADIAEVRILSIAISRRAPVPDAAGRRQAIVDEAVSKSQLEDAVRLALTVDVKWGDYDPEGLE